MENNCMAALKPSLRRELSKTKPDTLLDDDHPSSFDTPNGTEDYLSVDCFLDFPVGYEGEQEDEEEEKDSLSLSVSSPEDNNSNISSASFLSNELAVPDDDLAELEWVSHFVDDSSCELSLLVPSNKPERAENQLKRFEQEPYSRASRGASAANVLFPCQVPGKARSKRARPTSQTRTWSAGSPPSESSSLSSAASNSFPTPCLILSGDVVQPIDSAQSFDKPPATRPKKGRPVRADRETGSTTQFQRRCSHCQVQKTPQWRAGPLGPKTLCNACGVRYKSGRLFPEYRPACSPTFSGDIHSNSHRKVLEMRKRKEMDGPESGFNQMVPSF